MCAKLFLYPTRGSEDIERTRKRDGRTDRRTDGRVDYYMSTFGGIINHMNHPILIRRKHVNDAMVLSWYPYNRSHTL